MQLYAVHVTASGLTITPVGSSVPLDGWASIDFPGHNFEIDRLNDQLWKRGWSVSGPWKVSVRDGKSVELETVALRRR